MIVVGIDPGVETGFAAWNTQSRELVCVTSQPIHILISALTKDELLETWIGSYKEIPALFLVEDARKRRVFSKADENSAKYGAGVREGVGSAKRDAKIWDDFLKDMEFSYAMTVPATGKTKKNAALFKALTGWPLRTNEHMRDAAMLVYGLTDANVQSYLRQIKASESAQYR